MTELSGDVWGRPRPGHARGRLQRLAGPASLVILAAGVLAMGVFAVWWAAPIAAAVAFGEPSPRALHNNFWMPGLMALHAALGGVALLVGAFQFSRGLRMSRPRFHRWLGIIYIACVLPSAVAGIVLLPRTLAFGTGFATAIWGGLWLSVTALAVIALIRRDFASHRAWMMRSYALTCTAITIRLFLKAFEVAGLPPDTVYALSWVCAITANVALAEWLIRTPFAALGPVARAPVAHARGRSGLSALFCFSVMAMCVAASAAVAVAQRDRGDAKHATVDSQTLADLAALRAAISAYAAREGQQPGGHGLSCEHPHQDLQARYDQLITTLVATGDLGQRLAKSGRSLRDPGHCYVVITENGARVAIVFSTVRATSGGRAALDHGPGDDCGPVQRLNMCSADAATRCLCMRVD